jgi:hypothetical protein
VVRGEIRQENMPEGSKPCLSTIDIVNKEMVQSFDLLRAKGTDIGVL